jgi:phage FluMu protein Com
MTEVRCKYCNSLFWKADEKQIIYEYNDKGFVEKKCRKCKKINLFKAETLEVQDD